MLAAPVSFTGRLEQYVGRLHRDYAGKKDAVVYDYIDAHLRVFEAMYTKRLRTYKRLGYSVISDMILEKQNANAIYDSGNYADIFEQDLVEAEIFYTALFDTPKTRIFNRTVFHDMPNILTEILPDCKEYEDIVKVCHTEGMHLKLYSDIQNSETVLGFES